MRTLYIDCSMGAAGDMLTAALLELLDDPESFLEELNRVGLHSVAVTREPSVKCGITGTHIRVNVGGAEEDEHLHDHHHDHDHHHHHEHSGMHEIGHRVAHLDLPEAVRRDILAVYDLIAEAESHVHGVSVSEIHFHEVGTMDALADITAVCMLMHRLRSDRVVTSPVHVGSGQVKCAHGILPVPAPATAYILRDVPVYGGEIRGELCTPTGAALLKYFSDEFAPMPVMCVQKIGYGMGKKDFPAANCVRCLMGESGERNEHSDDTDSVVELQCNLDDMTGEAIGFAMDMLYEHGALEVFTTAVGAKKNRPAVLLTVLCRSEDREKFEDLIFLHTTTLGIRGIEKSRTVLQRSVVKMDTPFGEVRCKVSRGHGVQREKYEFEDLARIAREHDFSLREAEKLCADADRYR